MRVERARGDILDIGQFLSRKFLRLKLAAECFRRRAKRRFLGRSLLTSNETLLMPDRHSGVLAG